MNPGNGDRTGGGKGGKRKQAGAVAGTSEFSLPAEDVSVSRILFQGTHC